MTHNECKVCRTGRLTVVSEFGKLPRITSDCRPFEVGGELAVCEYCGTIQKLTTKRWFKDIERVYKNYKVYYQADGEEQVVFDERSGTVRSRSEVLIDKLLQEVRIPMKSKVLDIGCGNGGMLKSISSHLPNCDLFGHELDDSNLNRLDQIKRFKKLYTCPIGRIDRHFDLVTLIHSLEHFSDPFQCVSLIKEKLSKDGKMFVQVCDNEKNPFDLLIVDHLMHFTSSTLSLLLQMAGFEIKRCSDNWVNKELSLVAAAGNGAAKKNVEAVDVNNIMENIHRRLIWLKDLLASAKSVAKVKSRFGIFGTSIAATWLAGNIEEEIECFVDEDKNRVGRSHMGKRILSPDQLDSNRYIFLALVPNIAKQVGQRLEKMQINVIYPPDKI